MEKIDVVKRLIRSHNYSDLDRVYIRCLEMGIYVNKTALHRFCQKLALLDRAQQRSTTNRNVVKGTPVSKSSEALESDIAAHFTQTFESNNLLNKKPQLPISQLKSKEEHSAISDTLDKKELNFSEAKRREAEITFELGALKIKEHALLEELNALSKIIDEKH